MKWTVKEKAFAVQAFVRTGSASHAVSELSKGSRNPNCKSHALLEKLQLEDGQQKFQDYGSLI